MKWALGDEKQAKHFELLQKIAEKYPETLSIFSGILENDLSEVFDDIMDMTRFEIIDERYKLSGIRADFIIKLINYRFQYAKKIFDL
jgi:hypothetical protein